MRRCTSGRPPWQFWTLGLRQRRYGWASSFGLYAVVRPLRGRVHLSPRGPRSSAGRVSMGFVAEFRVTVCEWAVHSPWCSRGLRFRASCSRGGGPVPSCRRTTRGRRSRRRALLLYSVQTLALRASQAAFNCFATCCAGYPAEAGFIQFSVGDHIWIMVFSTEEMV